MAARKFRDWLGLNNFVAATSGLWRRLGGLPRHPLRDPHPRDRVYVQFSMHALLSAGAAGTVAYRGGQIPSVRHWAGSSTTTMQGEN